MNKRYMLPADADEVKRSELNHRMIQFLLAGANYVGPVKNIISVNSAKSDILDMGTGGGNWAMDIADEFEGRVEVIGVDLAPVQPRDVPANCTFELCDLDQYDIPYPDGCFDVVHARCMHHGIKNYPRFLLEVSRMLCPGGIFIIIEPDTDPIINGEFWTDIWRSGRETRVPGWVALWRLYHICLQGKGIDLAAPKRLRNMLQKTGGFAKVVTQQADAPIGFWPQDDTQLTIGQQSWMQNDLLLPGTLPLLLSTSGQPREKVIDMVKAAQHDLYHSRDKLATRFHVVHARKVYPKV
ncbi:S-adenosyl-L-methionine-dependent methyltransferase [Athelia psychrophila]|uniref:S-adenosyl-L-methionine-dependent methyltransferase n=1 Tax=Athelia psychrophila TaxID=1759441 RepID=A0A165Y749_9AGAM|nr:S-adenosyl-L-methionine-dependent methyltransferase [Fibularhizoctonia sp. CBS 109695]